MPITSSRVLTWLTWLVLLLTLGFLVGFFYLALVQRVSPLLSQRLVSVEAATTSGGHGTFIITREFCLSETSEAQAIRMFRRIPVKEGGLEEVYEIGPTPIHLRRGCHMRPRTVEVPDMIEPGRYIYETGLRFCNEVRCKIDWLPPTILVVDRFDGRHQLQIEPATDTPAPR